MSLFSLFRRHPRLAGTKRVRLSLEALEDRQLLSGLPPIAPPALPNAVINRIAQAEFRSDNGHLSRADMIGLFDAVDGTEKVTLSQGPVSLAPVSQPGPDALLDGSALLALRTLVGHSAAWGLAPDVANLAGKVVGYDQANVVFPGKGLLPSGELAAGDPATDMQGLVNKWFYGTDLPALDVAGARYELANGSLFGPKGPSSSDIAQGAEADCYFMAALGEAAQQTPRVIDNMFINDGDGIYTVRFFDYNTPSGTWQPDFVTVNSELPVNQQGQFVYANADFGGHATSYASNSNVLWVALAEKAYAQLAQEGWSRAVGTVDGSGMTSNPPGHANAYSTLKDGRNQIALQQITGFANGTWVNFPASNPQKAALDLSAVIADFQNGDLVTVATDTSVAAGTGLLGFHAYYVTSYNSTTQTLTLTNPYWNKGEKVVTVTLGVLEENMQGAAVVAPN